MYILFEFNLLLLLALSSKRI